MRTLETGWKILLHPHPKECSVHRQTDFICHTGAPQMLISIVTLIGLSNTS